MKPNKYRCDVLVLIVNLHKSQCILPPTPNLGELVSFNCSGNSISFPFDHEIRRSFNLLRYCTICWDQGSTCSGSGLSIHFIHCDFALTS
jgi:hypothetical protein